MWGIKYLISGFLDSVSYHLSPHIYSFMIAHMHNELTCAFIQVSTEASMPYKEINIDRAFLLLEYQYGEWRNECYQRRNSSSFIFVSFLRNLRQSDIIFFVLVFHKSSYLYPSFLEKKKKLLKSFFRLQFWNWN